MQVKAKVGLGYFTFTRAFTHYYIINNQQVFFGRNSLIIKYRGRESNPHFI